MLFQPDFSTGERNIPGAVPSGDAPPGGNSAFKFSPVKRNRLPLFWVGIRIENGAFALRRSNLFFCNMDDNPGSLSSNAENYKNCLCGGIVKDIFVILTAGCRRGMKGAAVLKRLRRLAFLPLGEFCLDAAVFCAPRYRFLKNSCNQQHKKGFPSP